MIALLSNGRCFLLDRTAKMKERAKAILLASVAGRFEGLMRLMGVFFINNKLNEGGQQFWLIIFCFAFILYYRISKVIFYYLSFNLS